MLQQLQQSMLRCYYREIEAQTPLVLIIEIFKSLCFADIVLKKHHTSLYFTIVLICLFRLPWQHWSQHAYQSCDTFFMRIHLLGISWLISLTSTTLYWEVSFRMETLCHYSLNRTQVISWAHLGGALGRLCVKPTNQQPP